MHVYLAAYKKHLRRNAAVACILAAGAVTALCMKRYSEVVPLAFLPLTVFSIVHVLFLSNLVKARQRFMARGDAEEHENQFDAEFTSEDALHFDRLHFTASWLFCDKPSDTFLMPVSEVVWMYRMTENNTNPHLVIHFDRDDKVEIVMEDGQIEAILLCAAARYPHVVVGYSKELAEAYDNDREAFRKKLAETPRILVDDSSPFIDPYYQTIVYVRLEGKKRKSLLALTREGRLTLICGEKTLFDRAAAELDSAASRWFGRLTLRFGHPDWSSHTVKTYNAWRWLSLIRKAGRGAPLGGYEKYAYSSVDSYNFAANQNRYYLRFFVAFFSLLFFSLIHLAMWVKGDSLWDEGIGMGIATYFLLPLLLPPIMLYGIFYLKDLQGMRLFPNREDGE